MSILSDKHAFYSYWDVYGKGINKDYLTTYSESIIFDSYNRSFYTEGKAFGNHEMGTYHGEIFNDFEHNHAYGDYSSASGTHVISYNPWEYGVGHYNLSQKDKTLFTVGNGNPSNPSNAFEIHFDNSSYMHGGAFVDDSIYVNKNAYIRGSLYINDLNVEAAYTYTFAYLGSYVGQTMKNAVKTMGLNQYYIWVGKTIDLPIASERYDNVIYIVVDKMPDNDKWYVDTDFDSLVFADSPLDA